MTDQDQQRAQKVLEAIADAFGMTPDPWVCDDVPCQHRCDAVRAVVAHALSEARGEVREAQEKEDQARVDRRGLSEAAGSTASTDMHASKVRPRGSPRLTYGQHECEDMSPPWFTGRWRDWHRGHGCRLDDGKPRSAAAIAEIEAHHG